MDTVDKYFESISTIWLRGINVIFTGNNKLSRIVSTEEDVRMQMNEWARTCQMEYYVGKCNVIHFDPLNRKEPLLKSERLSFDDVQGNKETGLYTSH